jgi:hypothetical protein
MVHVIYFRIVLGSESLTLKLQLGIISINGILYNIFLLLSLFPPFPMSPLITAWAYRPALGRGSYELLTVVTLLHEVI